MLDFCDAEIVEALQVPPARPGRDVPVRRDGRPRSSGTPAARSPSWRAASGSPPTRCCTPPAGRAPPTSSTSRRPGSSADNRGRIKVDEHFRTDGRAHLRRRRRHRLPRAGRHLDGAGPAGAPTTPSASRSTRSSRPAADRHLHDPRDQLRRRAPRRS